MYKRLGEYNQAKELHEKALIIRKKIFGEDHADLATSYNNLALVYERLGEYNQAKELQEKVLTIIQGRSQDFSVGTHSFPSHLFTPAPPQKKIKVIFDSRVFYFKSRAQES